MQNGIPQNKELELFHIQEHKGMFEEIKNDNKVYLKALKQRVYFYNLIIEDVKLTGKLRKS